MSKILLIEDNHEMQFTISQILSDHPLSVTGSLKEAKEKLSCESIHLILLDVSLPDGDGFKFCAYLQNTESTKDIPVLFLTSKSDTMDKVMGLSLGAEDYITKPFDMQEFKARVETRLRKINKEKKKIDSICKGNLKIIPSQYRATIKDTAQIKETSLDLTPLEFKILLFLVQHEDQILSRSQIIDSLWGNEINIIDRTIDGHISQLRKKISESSCQIQSVYGAGYCFTQTPPKTKKYA